MTHNTARSGVLNRLIEQEARRLARVEPISELSARPVELTEATPAPEVPRKNSRRHLILLRGGLH